MRLENMVLMKLDHVSKASWQPEIWYEQEPTSSESLPTPGGSGLSRQLTGFDPLDLQQEPDRNDHDITVYSE